MDIDLPCMTWLPFLCSQLRRLFDPKHKINQSSSLFFNGSCCNPPYKNSSVYKTSLLLLPDDIIINIFSRLDAGCAFQCSRVCRSLSIILSTPYFIAAHCSRAAPSLIIHCFEWNRKYYACDIVLDCIDVSGNTAALRMKLQLSYVWQKMDKPGLVGSYNGLLLFDYCSQVQSAFFLWNPLTQEQVTLISPEPAFYVCGIYFHSPTGEFRVLYIRRTTSDSKFYILSLSTQLLRAIPNCSQVPCTQIPPVILNGQLHWTASGCPFPFCSNFIVLFKIDSEVFTTLPHPRIGNCSSKRHKMMHLLDVKGQLGLCDVISPTNLHVWVLQEKQFWVRIHKINTKSVVPEGLHDHHCDFTPTLRALYIHNDELFLTSHVYQLFSYHLKLKTFTAIDTSDLEGKDLTSAYFIVIA